MFKIPHALCLGLVFLSSCGSQTDPNRKATSPVTGIVSVDGLPPKTPLKITCHDENGIDEDNPTISWCLSDAEGRFALNTYEKGDGVPVGRYRLTFEWRQWNAVSMSYGGSDRLKGRYATPQASKIHFVVRESTPVDLGTILLTTK